MPSAPRHRTFQPLRRKAREIAGLLAAELHRRWSVKELADVVHLSPSQLRRVFSEAYGKSPIAYLAMLRVERMVHLLKQTDSPISAIAASVGWGDPDFAARQFRRSVGVSPSEYHRITRKTPRPTHPDHRRLAEAARQANQFLSAAPARRDATRRDGPRL
ncbi:MAG: helix-turn-helix domain-containing protein [Beutenbergiaceae bacterium]